jgi:hypothetical protein
LVDELNGGLVLSTFTPWVEFLVGSVARVDDTSSHSIVPSSRDPRRQLHGGMIAPRTRPDKGDRIIDATPRNARVQNAGSLRSELRTLSRSCCFGYANVQAL